MTERQDGPKTTFWLELDWGSEEVVLPHYEYEGIGVVAVVMVQERGPSGWPVVRVTGELYPLAIWLCDEYCGADWQAANELLGKVEPVKQACEGCRASAEEHVIKVVHLCENCTHQATATDVDNRS